MKRFLILLVCAVLLWTTACAKQPVTADTVAGKTYVWEKDGFGGDFTVTLKKDGTYEYYEGYLSSYIGRGSWTLENGVLTLFETGGRLSTFRFAVKDGALVYLADGSDAFLYTQVEDGDRFIGREETP